MTHIFSDPKGLIPAHAGKTAARGAFRSIVWAHPRSRGENRPASASPWTDTGSSPLTRGKQALGGVQDTQGGLIPAHAGKTTPGGWPSDAHRAHPRSRGENRESGSCVVIEEGSSPLTRGKPGCPPDVWYRPGLIPAHAGKTHVTVKPLDLMRAHPRSRGENRHPC